MIAAFGFVLDIAITIPPTINITALIPKAPFIASLANLVDSPIANITPDKAVAADNNLFTGIIDNTIKAMLISAITPAKTPNESNDLALIPSMDLTLIMSDNNTKSRAATPFNIIGHGKKARTIIVGINVATAADKPNKPTPLKALLPAILHANANIVTNERTPKAPLTIVVSGIAAMSKHVLRSISTAKAMPIKANPDFAIEPAALLTIAIIPMNVTIAAPALNKLSPLIPANVLQANASNNIPAPTPANDKPKA